MDTALLTILTIRDSGKLLISFEYRRHAIAMQPLIAADQFIAEAKPRRLAALVQL
jgi:hypothetical protein